MTVTIYNRQGTRVSYSRNLRGVVRHAGKHGVNVVNVQRVKDDNRADGSRYQVTFYFLNSDTAATYWADWRVLLDWLATPKRSPIRLTLPEDIYADAYKAGRLKPVQAMGTVVTHT